MIFALFSYTKDKTPGPKSFSKILKKYASESALNFLAAEGVRWLKIMKKEIFQKFDAPYCRAV